MGGILDFFLGTEDSNQKRTDYLADRKHGDYEDYATDYTASANKWSGIGDDYLDAGSAINQRRFGHLTSAIQDQTASGVRDWQAAMAQQGSGVGAGGIGAQNILQANRRAAGDTSTALNKAYMDSFGLGLQAAQFGSGERSKAMTATGAADSVYAGANQAKMEQDSINAQKKAGFAQMVGGAALNMAMPGLGSLAGGVMKGWQDKGGLLGKFATPYVENAQFQKDAKQGFMNLLNYEPAPYEYRGNTALPSASSSYQMPSFQGFNPNFANTMGLMGYGTNTQLQTMPNWNAPQSSFIGPPTSGYQGAMTKAQRMAELGLPLPASLGGNL